MKIKSFLSFMLLFGLASAALTAQNGETLSLENLALPKSLGRVESKFTGSDTARWVIHIQDVHAHLTAQENIAALLTHLNENYGIQTAAIEGAWSSTSLPKSWGIPAGSRGKQVLAQALLEQDYITGSVHAALFSKTPLTLVGIEDKDLYEENRKLYLEYLAGKENMLPRIGILLHKIEAAKSNFYNPDLFEFDKKVLAFRDGKKIDAFLPSLLGLASLKEIPQDDLPQVQAFAEVLELQKSIDSKKLEGESKRLVEAFKSSRLGFEELLKSGKVPAEKLDFYPNAKIYQTLTQAQEKIPHRELFHQIDELILRLNRKLLGTSEEKTISALSDAFYTAKKIMLLQAAPEDLKVFETQRPDLAKDLSDLKLEEALDLGLRFYEIVKKRDQVFFDKIVKDPSLQGNIAVVTGGFHSDGMGEKFEEAGISYQVILPDLGESVEPSDEKLYVERLKENVSAQTLSELQNRIEGLDDGLAIAIERFDGGYRDIKKAIDVIFSFQPAAPADSAPVSENMQKNISNLSGDDLKQELVQSQNSGQKMTVVIKLSELMLHLKDSDSEKAALNRAALLAFLGNPKSILVIANDGGEVDNALLGPRNVRLMKRDIEKIVSVEAAKLTPQDAPLGVIASDYTASGPKALSIKPLAGIFGAIRLILEDSRFHSSAAIEGLMERAVAILRELFSLQAVNISA